MITAIACILLAATLGEFSEAVRVLVSDAVKGALQDERVASSISGTVTFAAEEFFFLQGKVDSLKILNDSDCCPHPGDVVIAEGGPSIDNGCVVFRADKVRVSGKDQIPAPQSIVGRQLQDFVGDMTSVNWKLATIRGRAIGRTSSGFAMEVEGLPVNVMIDPLPSEIADCDDTHPLLVVTGVVEQILDQSALFGSLPQVVGIKLHALDAESIVLEPDAKYLLNRRDRRVRVVVAVLFVTLSLVILALLIYLFKISRHQLRSRTLAVERKRMADDLHDTIEQHLVGAGMLLQLSKVKEAREILVRAKKEMRDIVWGLKNDDMMRLTPAEMLRELAKEENRKGLYRIDTKLESGLPTVMDASRMRDLCLVVRESIGNAVKHGGARKIAISSDRLEDGGWLLRVSNDGEQFDPAKVRGVAEGHFGLEGMRQRARRLGARLSFAERKGGMVMILEKSNDKSDDNR